MFRESAYAGDLAKVSVFNFGFRSTGALADVYMGARCEQTRKECHTGCERIARPAENRYAAPYFYQNKFVNKRISEESMSARSSTPTPEHFFRSVNAFQLTRALEGAIKLDVFTAIAEGKMTAKALAESRQASERGMRILCDYLAVTGFLTKSGANYGLTPDSAMFLDSRLPTYLGASVEFLLSPTIEQAFSDVAAAVRKGGTVLSGEGTMSHDNPVWVRFARAMQPLSFGVAQMVSGLVELDPGK